MGINDNPELLERSFKKHLESGVITERDEVLIRQYLLERTVTKHISKSRKEKIAYTLLNWRNHLPEYSKLTIFDVYEGIQKMPNTPNWKGTLPKQNTVHDYIKILKPFLLWMMENEFIILPEKKVTAIKAPPVDRNTISHDDLLSSEEITSLIRGSTSLRDKAFIATLYESGCRVGEVISLKWSDVVFDQYGIKLYITDHKTKKRRYSRLTTTVDYLASMKKDLAEDFEEDYVFKDRLGKMLSYPTVRKIFYRAIKNSGIKKRVHPHLFRHTRITDMIKSGYQESVVKSSIWGNVGTSMFSTYVNLSEQAIDQEFLSQAGIEVQDDEKEKVLQPIICSNCHHRNGPTARFCMQCGFPLSDAGLKEIDYLKELFKENPRYLYEIMGRTMRELGEIE